MTEWPPIREIAGHSACYMFSKYLIVSVFFFFFFFLLFFFSPRLLEWEFLFDCVIS